MFEWMLITRKKIKGKKINNYQKVDFECHIDI